ncbi:DUF4331 domain-containing protein [Lysobacter sp. D1-1-M9]|uniref:DUF4331 domain-containing protein n=2 Tax=Novilysobacter TaxID=3382699 RepID=UPI002FCBA935
MKRTCIAIAAASLVLAAGAATGSSHREAPEITEMPKVDNTDVYMFRSYEAGREGYVTLLANFQPFQDPFGGPNYFTMDDDAIYAIHIDNDGDAREDISYFFRFHKRFRNLTVPVNGKNIPIPLVNIGPFGSTDEQKTNRNVIETYTLVTAHERQNANANAQPEISVAKNLSGGEDFFPKPYDNIGTKSIPEYEAYADSHIQRAALNNCAGEARVFAGQRKEGFSIAVGEVFDLFHLNPLGPIDAEGNDLDDKNVTTLALEVPIACLTDGSPIIGAWSTASLPTRGSGQGEGRGRFEQVSRLSAPLVNEVVIGLPDKDKFNRSHPRNDSQFAKYVTYPTLPELLQILFPSVEAPNVFPRTDLVAAFLTGIEGLNMPENVRPAEIMRLNTSIEPTPVEAQSNLGVLGGDLAGFPNGRRPGDDVVDIELRVAMGVLLPEADAPSGQLPFTDGATLSATEFRDTFPYLNTPLPGATDD